jgi:hypothetical protein
MRTDPTHDAEDFIELIAQNPAAGFLPKAELSATAIRRLLDGRHRLPDQRASR